MKRIICFGDSNTYGYDPRDGGRYDEDTRWPKLLQKKLGSDYEVFEEGQNGRTIANADPWEGGTKCGMDFVLPMLESKKPVDLLIIMLGSNDLKKKFSLPVPDIAGSLMTMLTKIKGYCRYFIGIPDMQILILSPPALSEPLSESYFAEFFDPDTVERSKELAKWLGIVAKQFDCHFLDATHMICAGDVDHLHLSPEGHAKMSEIVFEKVKEILG